MTAVSQAYIRCNEKPPHGNAGVNLPNSKQLTSTLKVMKSDGTVITLSGRNAQVLRVLILFFKTGCIGLDFSRATTAFRWANQLCNLRRMGFAIETTHEKADDCLIGRYWLREPLQIVEGAA